MIKRIALAVLISATTAFTALAQEGLSIGAGYRGNLNKIYLDMPLHGFTFNVDYVDEETLGPIDLGVGINLARLWYNYPEPYTNGNATIASLDFQVPIIFRYLFKLDGICKPFIFLGPTVSLGISLKDGYRTSRQQYNLYNTNEEWVVACRAAYPWIEKVGVYQRWDCLLGGGIGAIFNDHIKVTVSADYGLVNRIKKSDIYGSIDAHNVQLNVGLAYCFD